MIRLVLFLSILLAIPAQGQSKRHVDDTTPSYHSIDLRIGWMLTTGSGYVDRPVVEGSGGLTVLNADAGTYSVALTGSAGVGIGDAFAERTLWSFRAAGGAEVRFATGSNAVVAPLVQIGYLTSLKEDERSGLYGRTGVAVHVRSRSIRYTLEPVSFTLLPSPDGVAGASRRAVEIGVIRIGRTF